MKSWRDVENVLDRCSNDSRRNMTNRISSGRHVSRDTSTNDAIKQSLQSLSDAEVALEFCARQLIGDAKTPGKYRLSQIEIARRAVRVVTDLSNRLIDIRTQLRYPEFERAKKARKRADRVGNGLNKIKPPAVA
ncbi:MAG TPA: hypothetical protein VF597_02545 [Candidatus Saccharimonadales bacterium]